MVRVGSFLAVSVWTMCFVACGAFEIEQGADFGDGGVRASSGGSTGAPDGNTILDPDARASEDAGPAPSEGCDLDKAGGVSLTCLDDPKFAVFVKMGADADIADGTKGKPFPSFTSALGNLNGKQTIFATSGEYKESVVLTSTVSIFGGFNNTFNNEQRTDKTIIIGQGSYALDLSQASQKLRLDDLELRGPDMAADVNGASSIGAFFHSISDAANPLLLRRVTLVGGNPGKGAAGSSPGPSGGGCKEGGAGSTYLGGTAARGAPSGQGGSAGTDDVDGGSCDATAGGQGGAGGGSGQGAPGSATYAVTTSGLAMSSTGAPADNGEDGKGGGGGGRGTSSAAYIGGNGGEGGCGGRGGGPGGPGGLSVGAMLWAASNVQLTDCTARAAAGGTGGDGGAGGAGGLGSQGTKGSSDYSSGFCGARGGPGGNGGPGGLGGGGMGGSAICLLQDDLTTTTLANAQGWCVKLGPGPAGQPGGDRGNQFDVAVVNGDGALAAK